jgi:L,D-transpeptidase ErfK/SrfK
LICGFLRLAVKGGQSICQGNQQMTDPIQNRLQRRHILGVAAAALAVSAAPVWAQVGTTEPDAPAASGVRNNISSFRMLDWRQYFDSTRNGAVLVDITSRALHFWSEDQSVYKLYPTSVPLSDDLTRKGKTEIVQKVVAPQWRPTPSMRERNPEWPEVVEGGSPDNPLGTHALYLSWTYYRIHGTHDTRKIGRKSSNGCVGLYNEHIQELFALTKVGTQVLLI